MSATVFTGGVIWTGREETDALLVRLLAHRPRVAQQPELGWDHLIEGYWLRGLDLSTGSSSPSDSE